MNETRPEKFESKTSNQCIQPMDQANMNTTQSMNAGVAIGLAQKPSPKASASTLQPAVMPTALRKTLAIGLLAVASCAAALLWFKAVVVINDVLASLDAAYKAFYT